MFEKYTADDRVLRSEAFVKDELEHNLIHMISRFEDSLKIKSVDDQLIFTQSKGYNPWLWVSRELESDQWKLRIEDLVQHVKGTAFPGITAEPSTARLFAESFCEGRETSFHTKMILVSYHCQVLIKPENVDGNLLQANEEHSEIIAEFMAGFSEDAFGMPATPQNFLSMAEEAARSGHLYLWMVKDTPVSMAKIAHRSVSHGRINEVYTPRAYRKRGYASATVAEICEMLLRENVTPMLYADAKNPDSNKVYQSIGFVEKGKMAEIKFD
ncbi:GNAT family N-acetyltransferase [Paenibacillus wynnii]|uniref:N-acetyltransferase domain-containing protein n=1 Tax=Paenibacillus wynnii TaxID=268407 RepID=A0A098M5R4_9BACL|nr:GNAT family N-acetyltransferase [Paenibacillus wynnii]KGE17894.1 hypothetical protein PWYN_25440 [Paenibacillus wynnii]